MRYIHPATWAGLLLNGMLMFVLFSALNSLSPADVPHMDPAVFEVLGVLQPVALFLLGLQAVSVGLIASRFKAGLALAVFASFFMLPAGLVYLIGCILSHYRCKYAGLEMAFSSGPAQAVFPQSSAATLPYATTGGFVLCAVCIVAGLLDMGVMFLGLGLTGIYLSLRARKCHALSLHQTYFTVTPGLFADPLPIPYAAVQSATLCDDESIRFALELAPGRQAELVWSLLRVDKKNRRAALESLGEALAAHHVPLY